MNWKTDENPVQSAFPEQTLPMLTAYIDTPGCHVRMHSGRLQVFAPPVDGQPEESKADFPAAEVERVVLHEHTRISSESLTSLLHSDKSIAFIGWNGRFLGGFEPPTASSSATRLQQYQRTLEPPFVLAIARALVTAKIANQTRLLQKANANRPLLEATEWSRMNGFAVGADNAVNLDGLRGYEGGASACYFPLWARFLPEEFPFERRCAHPPCNAVNACLSFASSMVYGELTSQLHLRGLDPGLGYLHVTEDRRWSLALDLMEPFRPALIESLTLRLFNHQMLKANDFEPREGGIYLNDRGRKTLLAEFEQRMSRSFMSEHVGQRTTIRQQLRQIVVDFKVALADPTTFRPFRLN